MDNAPTLHPADETLVSYGLGKLDDTVAHSVNLHLEQCKPCRQRVTELSGDNFLQRLQQAQAPSDQRGPKREQPEAVARTYVEAGGPTPSRAQTIIGPRQEFVSDPGGASPPRQSAPLREPIPPELLEQSQYKIVRELGRGGMGVVYLANNRLMGRPEVLKVMNREVAAMPGTVDRFLREIRSAARLQHPNVVTAYAAQKLGDLLFFSMEYVEGEDLAKLVRTRGPLPLINAVYYIYQAAQGLQHAHEKGMVHRDIKPSNMILYREGKKAIVKILDFGLAKLSSERKVDTTLTGEGQMLGTPDYVAPEQTLDAQHADIRADIYSLGCTMYYLLAGEAPFSGRTHFEVLQKHHQAEARPLTQIRRDVTPELAAVVAKMMAKTAEQRYQTPYDVVQALKPFLKPEAMPKSGAEAPVKGPHALESAAGLGMTLIEEEPVLLPLAPASPDERWKSLLDFSAPDTSTKRVSAVRKRRTAWPRWAWFAGAMGIVMAGFSAALALGLFRVQTKDGVIVLKNLPNDADVLVDGDKVTVTVPPAGKPAEITVVPGTHEIKVRQGDLTVYGKRVAIADGGREELVVEVQADQTAPDEPVAELSSTTAPAAPADAAGIQLRSLEAGQPPAGQIAAAIPADAQVFRGHSYKFFPEQVSWRAAKAKCAALGGHLVIIDDLEENSFAGQLAADAGALDAWIGATDESQEGTWKSVNGDPLTFVNWFETQPNGMAEGEDFVLISNRRYHNGPIGWKWFDQPDESDQNKPGYLCEWDLVAAPSAIPTDAKTFGGHSYKFFPEKLTWHDAKAKCVIEGGHLIAIDSADENAFAATLIADAGWVDSWIGATDEEKQGDWKSVDGAGLTYSNWFNGEPNNESPHEHYVVLSNRELTFPAKLVGWKWVDQPADSKAHVPGYLCEWEPQTADPKQARGGDSEGIVRIVGKPGPGTTAAPGSLAQSDPDAIRHAELDRGANLRVSTNPTEIAEIVGEAAPGFSVRLPVHPGGVALVAEHFGRARVLSVQPFSADIPCILTSSVDVPADAKTMLTFDVSHHSTNDWRVVVLANGEQLYAQTVGPKTALNGWLTVTVDLTRFAGQQVDLELHNKATGYYYEYAFWDKVKIISHKAKSLERPGIADSAASSQSLPQSPSASTELSPSESEHDGFVPLFNGRNLDGWKTHPSQPWNWRVENGVLVGSASASYLYTTRDDYADFHLRVVARINDQGNSGVMFRTAFGTVRAGGIEYLPGCEAQINSTHSNENKTGTLYVMPGGIKSPQLSTPIKPDEWFTMEVVARQQHIVVKVNGTTTAEYDDGQFTKGHIAVQQLGPQTFVEFRTIEIKELGANSTDRPAVEPAEAPAAEADGFVPLFNGKNLDGWKTHPSQPGNWRVENGILAGSGPDISHLYTKRSNFTDFHLRVVARINDGGNSGVHFRTGFGPDVPDRSGTPRYLGGYEGQINSTHKDANKTGSLYITPGGAVAPVLNTPIKPGEWFTMEVLVQKRHIVITVNGSKTAEYDDARFTKGHIALQQHNAQTVVEFRTIEIKEGGTRSTDNLTLDAATSTYKKAVAVAKGRLIADLQKVADEAQKEGDKRTLDKILAEQSAFTDSGILPQSVSYSAYRHSTVDAANRLAAEYERAIKEYTKKNDLKKAGEIETKLMDLQRDYNRFWRHPTGQFIRVDDKNWEELTPDKLRHRFVERERTLEYVELQSQTSDPWRVRLYSDRCDVSLRPFSSSGTYYRGGWTVE